MAPCWPAPSEAGTDATTQGSWQGIYGSNGYEVIATGANYPGYAIVTPSGQQSYTWITSTSDALTGPVVPVIWAV